MTEEVAVLSDVLKEINGRIGNTAMLSENMEDGLQQMLVTTNGLMSYTDELYRKLGVVSQAAS